MMDVFRKVGVWGATLGAAGVLAVAAVGQQDKPEAHGRKYVAPPPVAHVVVTVEKGFNGKPLTNAAVIFHATRDGKTDGNLEVKTNPDGQAIIDLLEIGSHVEVQVLANGFSTYATEFDLTSDSKEVTIKMERPKAQISTYVDNTGKPANLKPGVQEHIVPPAATGTTGATGVTGSVTGSPK
jgi:hypothetical protein